MREFPQLKGPRMPECTDLHRIHWIPLTIILCVDGITLQKKKKKIAVPFVQTQIQIFICNKFKLIKIMLICFSVSDYNVTNVI